VKISQLDDCVWRGQCVSLRAPLKIAPTLALLYD
jgi:hypothetical protein